MFGKIVKSIVTATIILVCLFFCILGIAFYGFAMDDLDFDLRNSIAMGEIKEVYAVPAGDTYNGDVLEDSSYYEVYITYKNTGNYAVDYMALDLEFMQVCSDYGERKAANHYLAEDIHRSLYCVPGGKEGILRGIIELQNNFESVKVIYTDGYTKEEQVIDLEIRER